MELFYLLLVMNLYAIDIYQISCLKCNSVHEFMYIITCISNSRFFGSRFFGSIVQAFELYEVQEKARLYFKMGILWQQLVSQTKYISAIFEKQTSYIL